MLRTLPASPTAPAMKLLLCLFLALAPAASAQTPPVSDRLDHTTPMDPDATVPPDTASMTDPEMSGASMTEASMTEAERRVADILATDGLHVVHFWAPWCDNSVAELRAGWYDLVARHPEVSFTFVTVWNDGASGRETLDQYGLPERVLELTQPDVGPSDDKAQRRRRFLGLPVTWIPTTWVFRDGGTLAYAFNYGELEMAQLDRAIAGARSAWPHD